MKIKKLLRTTAMLTFGTCSIATQAADWSDTYIGYSYGTQFEEPYVNQGDITKSIIHLSSVDGYSLGTNFFDVDFLMSDSHDPAGQNTTSGATEAYVVYRNTVAFSKLLGKSFKYGVISDLGTTFGFDANAKTDAGYNSKKRMGVLGPTVMFDVPGFLNVSLLELWESNAPCSTFTNSCISRYNYKPHPMLSAAWGIPIGSSPFSFEGYALWIASKGTNEFGGQTVAETNIDMEIMLDVGAVSNGPKGKFKVGFEYQYWKNKFGNDYTLPGDSGAFAKTPMIRGEYHF